MFNQILGQFATKIDFTISTLDHIFHQILGQFAIKMVPVNNSILDHMMHLISGHFASKLVQYKATYVQC